MNFIPQQNLHKSQPCNYKRVIVIPSFGAESFVFQFVIQKYEN